MTIQVEPPVRVAAGVRVDTTGSLDAAFEPLVIAVDRCKGCSLCVSVCPKHVLELDEGVVNPLGYHPVRLIDGAACTSCALCARVCPDAVFAVFAPWKVA